MLDLTQAQIIIREMIPDIHADKDLSGSQYIQNFWTQYMREYDSNRSVNGAVFEELIAITLIRKQIMPFYMQAQIAFIPNAIYDFVIYCQDIGPLILSAKVSIRERYKQADLEAVVLKNVHRKSESYLISLNQIEVNARKYRLDEVMAINDFTYAFSSEYDDLLQKISEKQIIAAPIIRTVISDNLITSDNFEARWS
jgi:hypothetical protein